MSKFIFRGFFRIPVLFYYRIYPVIFIFISSYICFEFSLWWRDPWQVFSSYQEFSSLSSPPLFPPKNWVKILELLPYNWGQFVCNLTKVELYFSMRVNFNTQVNLILTVKIFVCYIFSSIYFNHSLKKKKMFTLIQFMKFLKLMYD